MLNSIMAASLQYVVETNQITLNICFWVGYRVSNASLRCQVCHNVRFIFGENIVDSLFISNILFYENEPIAVNCKAL